MGSKTQKVLVKSAAKPMAQKTQQEHLRLIDLLKNQLKKAEMEIESLHTQLHTKGLVKSDPITNDVHEKNIKITALQSRFENLEHAYATQKQMLDKTRQMLEEANDQLIQEKNRIAQLETQVRTAELASHTAKDLQLQLEESERERRKLEATIKDLTSTPFFRDIEVVANPERLKVNYSQWRIFVLIWIVIFRKLRPK